MSLSMLGLCVLMATAQAAGSPQQPVDPPGTSRPNAEQDLIDLSKEKWRWMAERDVDALAALFHDDAVFVHMGGTMSRTRELEVIRSGGIHYKHAEIQDVSVRVIGGTTAILLNRIRLDAVVGGKEVTNPFVVTEVYVQEGGTWKLGSMSFTRLLGAIATANSMSGSAPATRTAQDGVDRPHVTQSLRCARGGRTTWRAARHR